MIDSPFKPKKTRVKQRAERFYGNIESLDLKKKLVSQAREILSYIHRELTPAEKARIANKLLKQYPELDPTLAIDSYGIEQTMALLAPDTKDAVAGRRLFRSIIDSYLKYKGGNISIMEICYGNDDSLKMLLFEEVEVSLEEKKEYLDRVIDLIHDIEDKRDLLV